MSVARAWGHSAIAAGALLACTLCARQADAQRLPPPPDTTVLRDAQARAGTDATRWLAVAGGWLQRADTAQAMRVLAAGVPVASDARLLRVALGELRLRRGDPAGALAAMAPLSPSDTLAAPLRAAAEMQRAVAQLGRGDTAAAVAAVERAWRAKRDEPTGLALVQLLRVTRSARTGPLADSLAARPTASAAAFAIAGEVAQAQGRLPDADSVLARGAARHPRSGELWLQLGDVRKQRRDWRGGALAYSRAIGALADPIRAELALARLYLASGDTTSALGVWRAMTAAERSPAAVMEGAERLRRFDALTDAEDAFARLAASDAADGAALVALAEVAEARGQRDTAVVRWRTADPVRSSGAWPSLALLRLGAFEGEGERRRLASRALWRGLAVLQEAERATGTGVGSPDATANARAEDRPDDPMRRLRDALQPLADALAADTAWGAREVASARRAFGTGRLLGLAVARASRAAGDARAALAQLEPLVEREPADLPLRRDLAETLEQLGEPAAARAAWGAVLELDPEADAPFRALVRLASDATTLEQLALHVQRLRDRRPASTTLVEREIEVWHRLGRSDAATRAAAELSALRRSAEERTP